MTDAERKWVRRLQRVLTDCPSDRLGFFTIGDATVTIYDKDKESLFDEGLDFCRAVDEWDARLGEVIFPSNVHSTAG